jgi:endoglucanase
LATRTAIPKKAGLETHIKELVVMAKKSSQTLPSSDTHRKKARVNRRDMLKYLGSSAMAAVLPRFTKSGVGLSITKNPPADPASSSLATNPKWYGFNLLEYFSTDPDWMKYFPYENDGMFLEDDFRWIHDWGFNWVRLPMDYRFWTDTQNLFKIHEEKIEPIDRAIRLGDKYSVHVNLCLHRAPGYCILDIMDEALTGIHVTREKLNVFTDARARDAFCYQWTYFATRYKGISSEKLSFNLVNEPLDLQSATKIEELMKAGKKKEEARREVSEGFARQYEKVARSAIEAIREQDPKRLIVSDGIQAGNEISPSLFDTHVLQSCHTYTPAAVTHYQCEWARGNAVTGSKREPTWPLKDATGKIVADHAFLADTFRPWSGLAAQGVPIHFGEMGCYKHTPPSVVLAWFNDTLRVVGDLHSGFALWNFRGPFGVLDTERPGTNYKDWHGHKLDSALLTVLQQKMRS